METAKLITRLAADTSMVRRLHRPWLRAMFWLAIALPYVAVVVGGKLMMVDPAQTLADLRFMIEQAATFATALTAAFAAFCSVVPGFDRRMLLVPLGPLAVWIASVGQGCVQDWLQFGADGLAIRPDWDCLPSATIIGIVPAVAMVVMLRRGAPLHPRLSLMLGALAVAAIGNFGMQFFHFRDASIMMLVWHLGNVAILSALAGCIAHQVLGWRHAKAEMGGEAD
jgi:hypothetical protein